MRERGSGKGAKVDVADYVGVAKRGEYLLCPPRSGVGMP